MAPEPVTALLDRWIRLLCAGGHRVSGSLECRAAAAEIRKSMEAAGLATEAEEFDFRASHPHGLVLHFSLLVASALLTLAGHPTPALGLSLLVLVSVYGSETGRYDLFNLLLARRRGANIVGRWNPSGARRLVVLAHHDGTRQARVFEPGRARKFAQATKNWPLFLRAPFFLLNLGVAAVVLSALARHWVAGPAVAVPALYGAASLSFGILIMADWARGAPIPAAGDNASAVAAMMAVAGGLRERCPKDLEVWCVATDAEELGLKGAAAFCKRHAGGLRDKPTIFVNLESLGSGRLCRLAREAGYLIPGAVPYPPIAGELVEAAARRLGRRPLPVEDAPAGTDGQVLIRFGLRGVSLLGLLEIGYVENYHWPTDTPDNVDLKVAAEAVEWTWAIAASWAGDKYA
ncbi:MAG: M28 family peptidase [Halobacteria archaeon]